MKNANILISIVLLVAVAIISFTVVLNNTYYRTVTNIEDFILPKIDTSSDFMSYTSGYKECPTDLRYDIYQLRENYFRDTQRLTINVVVHYFPNSEKNTLSDTTVERRIQMMSDFFKNSNAGLNFQLSDINIYKGKPTDNVDLLKSIRSLEGFLGKRREDLRNYYYGEHVDFHNNYLNVVDALNIYIYNDKTGFSGKAGAIESNYFAVNLKYMHPQLYTLEHEAGHCYGLYHTHTVDNSGFSHSNEGGDYVCDTHVTFPLSNIVDNNCALFRDWKDRVKLPPVSNPISSWDDISPEDISRLIVNVMSYTRHTCRKEFTYEQVRRMRKILETNKDLRRTVRGLEVDIKEKILKNLTEMSI